MAGDDHWFVPKPYGYGAMPANAKGWAAVLVAVAVIAALGFNAFGGGSPTTGGLALFIGGTLVVAVALTLVARRKTKGEWRWRSRQDAAS